MKGTLFVKCMLTTSNTNGIPCPGNACIKIFLTHSYMCAITMNYMTPEHNPVLIKSNNVAHATMTSVIGKDNLAALTLTNREVDFLCCHGNRPMLDEVHSGCDSQCRYLAEDGQHFNTYRLTRASKRTRTLMGSRVLRECESCLRMRLSSSR